MHRVYKFNNTATNQLIAYAASLRGQASFIADNVGNQQKIMPWLTQIHTMLYAADHLGLSSLNEFKSVMKALNNPIEANLYINPEIVELLAPSPTPYELNVYVLEMCERNGFQLEEINMVGHRFDENPQPPSQEPQKKFSDMEKQLADQFEKNGMQPKANTNGNQGFNNRGYGNQGFGGNPYGNQGYGPNQGFNANQGGYGGYQGQNNQGNFGMNQQYGGNQPDFGGHGGNPGYGGNQGFGGNTGYGNDSNQGGNGGQGFNYQGGSGNGGYSNQAENKFPSVNSVDSNPYGAPSRINNGPDYYNPSQYDAPKH